MEWGWVWVVWGCVWGGVGGCGGMGLGLAWMGRAVFLFAARSFSVVQAPDGPGVIFFFETGVADGSRRIVVQSPDGPGVITEEKSTEEKAIKIYNLEPKWLRRLSSIQRTKEGS